MAGIYTKQGRATGRGPRVSFLIKLPRSWDNGIWLAGESEYIPRILADMFTKQTEHYGTVWWHVNKGRNKFHFHKVANFISKWKIKRFWFYNQQRLVTDVLPDCDPCHIRCWWPWGVTRRGRTGQLTPSVSRPRACHEWPHSPAPARAVCRHHCHCT